MLKSCDLEYLPDEQRDNAILQLATSYLKIDDIQEAKIWNTMLQSVSRHHQNDASYNLAYIHPRDLDKGQPVLQGLPPIRRFKSYYGLASTESKLRRYLSDFSFTDIHTAAETVDWEAVPSIIPTNWD